MEDDPKAVTLLTLHAAKGLEYPVVFLTGLEDGVLPHSRSMEDSESMAEERRLFYVGLTRAKDVLYITHAFRRTVFGQTEVAIPSRFLQDIPHGVGRREARPNSGAKTVFSRPAVGIGRRVQKAVAPQAPPRFIASQQFSPHQAEKLLLGRQQPGRRAITRQQPPIQPAQTAPRRR